MKNINHRAMAFGRLFFLSVIAMLIGSHQVAAQCPGEVDLQAVSMDPSVESVGVGQTAQIIVVMKNNGPCDIPTGEATVTVTLSSLHFDLGLASNFTDICSPQFVFQGAITADGYHVLYFRNLGGPIYNSSSPTPPNPVCYFSFDVVGKIATSSPSPITLSSSLSATAMSSDINGTNQSVSTELNVITVLPVKLSAFTAEPASCKTLLKWTAQLEVDSKEYQVEVSKDGRTFKAVGTVKSSSNSNSSLSYEFTHNAPSDGTNFYRLKMVSNSGSIEYSKTIAIENSCNGKTIVINPNPVVENQLAKVVIGGYTGTLKGELLSISGQLVKSYVLKNGLNLMPIQRVTPGTYILRVTELSTGAAETYRLVIIK